MGITEPETILQTFLTNKKGSHLFTFTFKLPKLIAAVIWGLPCHKRGETKQRSLTSIFDYEKTKTRVNTVLWKRTTPLLDFYF